MKTKILLLLSLVICVSEAQIISRYGFKISFTNSNIIVKDKKPFGNYGYMDYNEGNSVNPAVGIFSDFKIIDNLEIETELSYVQKGSRKTTEVHYTTADDPDGNNMKSSDLTSEIGLHYLVLGINLHPTIHFGDITTYGIIGSSMNYLIQVTSFLRDDIKDFSVGYSVGIGTDVSNIINLPLFIELKYCGDFSQFYSSVYGNYWNRVMFITVGTNL